MASRVDFVPMLASVSLRFLADVSYKIPIQAAIANGSPVLNLVMKSMLWHKYTSWSIHQKAFLSRQAFVAFDPPKRKENSIASVLYCYLSVNFG